MEFRHWFTDIALAELDEAVVRGNTYNYRDLIKTIPGWHFDRMTKTWSIPDNMVGRFNDLVAKNRITGLQAVAGQAETQPAPMRPPAQGQKPPYLQRRDNPVLDSPQASQQAPEQKYYLATIKGPNRIACAIGSKVAAAKRQDGYWDVVRAKDLVYRVIDGTTAGEILQGDMDEQGKRIWSYDYRELLRPFKPAALGKKKFDLSDEQQQIDARFQSMMSSPGQNHMMINALAGAGKTTMLKHLADTYWTPNQKWLYLVFNSKNQEEAAEKFPRNANFVVATTNVFLGTYVLGSNENKAGGFPQTSRSTLIGKQDRQEGEEGGGKSGNDAKTKEKMRFLVDGKTFHQMLESWGITRNVQGNHGEWLDKFLRDTCIPRIQDDIKEEVLRLAGLAKAFAHDPRVPDEALRAQLEEILKNYDFDLTLSDMKERIRKYKGQMPITVPAALRTTFGFDFMTKNFREEIIQGAIWLLRESMPHASTQMYRDPGSGREYNLGGYRDFKDDLWYTAVHANEIHWPHYDVVLADEVQDFNQAHMIMLRKLAEAGAKIVAVGDPNQAIYRFNGADSYAFNRLRDMLSDLSADKDSQVEYGLSQNFRSRQAIIDFANQATKVKNLKRGKYFDDGWEGEVTNKELKYKDAFDRIKWEFEKEGEVKNTAFISRTNEPLAAAAMELLWSNIPFMILGKDISTEMLRHLAKAMKETGLKDGDPAVSLRDALDSYMTNVIMTMSGAAQKVHRDEAKGAIATLRKCLERFLDESGATVAEAYGSSYSQSRGNYRRGSWGDEEDEAPGNDPSGPTLREFKEWLRMRLGGLDIEKGGKDLKLFKERLLKENPVILCTSHKSKGLEFDRVFILRDDQFPHPKTVKSGRKEDLEQEENSRYVAYTRARDELHILDLEDQPGCENRSEDEILTRDYRPE